MSATTARTETPAPAFEDVRQAARRIQGLVHRTPVMHSCGIDALTSCTALFKCENLQVTGAFKLRGATNAVMSLPEDRLEAGVATHSSGNHGAALARAAGLRGMRATVVMPRDANQAKKDAVIAYGATLVECEPTQRSREEAMQRLIEETGCEAIPPFDDARVIAGQGTCAMELLEQEQVLDALVAPVGGGGLLAGSVLATRALSPRTVIYGAEPEAADDTWHSFRAGHRIPLEAPPQTLADGLKTSVGHLTFPIINAGVSDILRTTEAGIVTAMRLIWQRMKLVVEPSGAVPLACVMENPEAFKGKRVGIILSGGNVDLDRLPWCCMNELCRWHRA